jgi:hypothetical protein
MDTNTTRQRVNNREGRNRQLEEEEKEMMQMQRNTQTLEEEQKRNGKRDIAAQVEHYQLNEGSEMDH